MKLTAYYPAYTDEFGDHPERTKEWEPPLLSMDYCYAVEKRFGKYIVREMHVYEYFFTNIWGWRMTNGRYFTADDYGEILFGHDELQKAIEICEKKNRMRRVKVVRIS